MLVICEDCAKKYHIDESRIKGQRAKFACKACGHIIVVEKPESLPDSAVPTASSDLAPVGSLNTLPESDTDKVVIQPGRKAAEAAAFSATTARGRGNPLLLPLLGIMVVGFLLSGGAFLFLYLRHVPAMIRQESELRSLALAVSLEQAVKTPLLRKDYLLVNQETQRMAKLPGVAYAAVVNEKGLVVAGFFNIMTGFDDRFSQKVKEKGFPVDVLAQNGLKTGAKEGSVRINMGGLPVDDRVLALTEGNGEVHVGLPALESGQSLSQVLVSPLLLIPAGLALLFAGLLLVTIDWLVIRPARTLTNTANRISLGELDLAIAAVGSREMRDLGLALERMRHSVRIAVERMIAKP
ncbi:zinc-ribbon domain-containing protein [Candidatus Electronema sp. PJ]|uniref:zinc-ribbon domain-containing protein n=1 Tax=Candidatus Electronema sp. PJ TaxID=3401572 RepID=UPI003AA8F6CF